MRVKVRSFAGFRNILGKEIETLLPDRVRPRHRVNRREFAQSPAKRIMGRGRDLYARRKDGSEFPVEVGLGFMTSETGLLVSAVVVDITARKTAEAQREALITELKEALGKVKMLSGMLPICASCKKIRDDKGYWNQIEAFIRDHAEVEFSHGICPDCAARLYPDVYKNNPDAPAPE